MIMKRKMARVWAILIMVIMLMQMLPAVAYASDFGGGTGIEGDPYIISSEAYLQEMADKVNNTETNATFGSVYYVLTADIELTQPSEGQSNHTPIGSSDYPFAGNFEGNGYTINGLVIDLPEMDNVGLFGFTNESAVIKNVGLENVDVTGNQDVGGLVLD